MPDYQLMLVVFIRTQLSILLQKANRYHTHVAQTKTVLLKIGNKLSITPGEGTPIWNGRGCPSSRLEGLNFGFRSRLGCSGQNVIIFSRQGLVKGCTRRNNKKLLPRPDWSLLGVKFKISDEHPSTPYGSLPPPLGYNSTNTR